MRMSALSLIFKILSFIFHIISLFTIFFIFQPIAKWYLGKVPALGVDLYYSATYVSYHLRNFSLTVNSFKDIWFEGYPLFRDIGQLHFYLMLPLAKYIGLIEGIRIYAVVSLLCLVIISYFLFYQLSKNFILALVCAALIFLSPNIYGAATWGGSIPYFATQMFFPLSLLFFAKYHERGDKRWFYLSALVSGVGALSHPAIVSFVFPAAFFLIFFSFSQETRYPFLRRLADFLIFVFLVLLISLRLFVNPILNTLDSLIHGSLLGPVGFLGTGTTGQAEQGTEIANFYRGLANLMWEDTARLLFYLLGVGVLIFVLLIIFFKDRTNFFFNVLPYALIVGFLIAHGYVNAYGFNFLFHGWYREFWTFPIAIGALAAVLWGQFFRKLSFSLDTFKKNLAVSFIKLSLVGIISIIISWFGYRFYRDEVNPTIQKIEAKSELSSAYPEVLSIKTNKEDLEELKKGLVPSFMNPNDKNKRLYTADAAVNIWWNALFDMPLARGYQDPPIAASQRGGLFWLDIAIANDSLVRDFKVSEEIAYNNALFLMDWYAINYFEGGRLGSKGPAPPPSSYLLQNEVFYKEEEVTTYGAVLKYQTESGKPELHMELPQTLKFYRLKEKFASPILAPSDAPAIIVFSDRSGYEDILRLLASKDLNSKKLIPVYGGQYIDEFNLDQLSNFDAVILHSYDYHNKNRVFDMLYDFTEKGGKVFIDTGAEVKESTSLSLPEIFPITALVREGMGEGWNLELIDSPLTGGVEIKEFGPPIFNDSEWKLSIPSDGSIIKGDSEIVLKNYGKPVLIERTIGKGKVVWSGMNLAYHYNQYKSDSEAKLFINILDQFITLDEKATLPAQVKWLKPEKVLISGDVKPSGILFKEQGYKGWNATAKSERNKNLPVYLAGPTYPGFMYVPLSSLKENEYSLEFKYQGELHFWVITFISVISSLLILEKVFFNGRLLGSKLTRLTERMAKKIGSWWEKEEE